MDEKNSLSNESFNKSFEQKLIRRSHDKITIRRSLSLKSLTYLCKCCYCSKVFFDSKFLLKHILRRHSEIIPGSNYILSDNVQKPSRNDNFFSKEPDNDLGNKASKGKGSCCDQSNFTEQISNIVSIQEKICDCLKIYEEKSEVNVSLIIKELNELNSKLCNSESDVKYLKHLIVELVQEMKSNYVHTLKEKQNVVDQTCKKLSTCVSHELQQISSALVQVINTKIDSNFSSLSLKVEKLNEIVHPIIKNMAASESYAAEKTLKTDVESADKKFHNYQINPGHIDSNIKKTNRISTNFQADNNADIFMRKHKNTVYVSPKEILNLKLKDLKIDEVMYITDDRYEEITNILKLEDIALSHQYATFSDIREKLKEEVENCAKKCGNTSSSKNRKVRFSESNIVQTSFKRNSNDSIDTLEHFETHECNSKFRNIYGYGVESVDKPNINDSPSSDQHIQSEHIFSPKKKSFQMDLSPKLSLNNNQSHSVISDCKNLTSSAKPQMCSKPSAMDNNFEFLQEDLEDLSELSSLEDF